MCREPAGGHHWPPNSSRAALGPIPVPSSESESLDACSTMMPRSGIIFRAAAGPSAAGGGVTAPRTKGSPTDGGDRLSPSALASLDASAHRNRTRTTAQKRTEFDRNHIHAHKSCKK